MFNDVLNKRVFADGQVLNVPSETTPGRIIQTIGKNPNTTSLYTRGPNGTSQYLPTTRPINVRDGQEFESTMTGIGG